MGQDPSNETHTRNSSSQNKNKRRKIHIPGLAGRFNSHLPKSSFVYGFLRLSQPSKGRTEIRNSSNKNKIKNKKNPPSSY